MDEGDEPSTQWVMGWRRGYQPLSRFSISSSGTPLVSGMIFSAHINCSTIMLA